MTPGVVRADEKKTWRGHSGPIQSEDDDDYRNDDDNDDAGNGAGDDGGDDNDGDDVALVLNLLTTIVNITSIAVTMILINRHPMIIAH